MSTHNNTNKQTSSIDPRSLAESEAWTKTVHNAIDSAKDLSTTGLGRAVNAGLKHFEKHSYSGVLLTQLVNALNEYGLKEQGERVIAVAKYGFGMKWSKKKGQEEGGTEKVFYSDKTQYANIDPDFRIVLYFTLQEEGLNAAFKYVNKHLEAETKKEEAELNGEKEPSEDSFQAKLVSFKKSFDNKLKDLTKLHGKCGPEDYDDLIKAIQYVKSELSKEETALTKAKQLLAERLLSDAA